MGHILNLKACDIKRQIWKKCFASTADAIKYKSFELSMLKFLIVIAVTIRIIRSVTKWRKILACFDVSMQTQSITVKIWLGHLIGVKIWRLDR